MKRISSKASFSLLALATALSPSLAAAACQVYTTGSNQGKIETCDAGTNTVKTLILNVTGWVLGFSAAVAILFIIYGGLQYVTAAGNEKRAESAKQTLTFAVIGLIVILLANVIVAIVGSATSAVLTSQVTTP
jgi:hypothetical protein